MNFGKLRERIAPESTIVYYRRGMNELSLNITNACPNACTFCVRDRDPGWGVANLYLERDPSVEEICAAFDNELGKIDEQGVRLEKVKICGYGEPILRFEDLKPIARHIQQRSPTSIQVTTTGWPYFKFVCSDASRLEGLRNAGITDIYLSLSTTNPQVYQKLVRPGVRNLEPGAFEESIRFARSARDAGLAVTLGFIRLANLDERAAVQLATEMGISYKIRDYEP
ncbi:MAG: radical SAM protein [Nanoarchaeota archaeon]